MQYKPYEFIRVSSEQVDFYNQIYKNWPPIKIDSIGHILVSNFAPQFKNIWQNEDPFFELKIGIHQYLIRVKSEFNFHLAKMLELNCDSQDEFILQMVTHAIFEPFANQLAPIFKRDDYFFHEIDCPKQIEKFAKIEILFIEQNDAADVSVKGADASNQNQTQWPIEIYMDFNASMPIYDFAKNHKGLPIFPQIRHQVPLVIAKQYFGFEALKEIKSGDFILFKPSRLAANQAILPINKTLQILVRLEGNQVIIEEKIMSEIEPIFDETEVASLALDTEVSFDMGSIEVEIDTLSNIGAGHIFELKQNLDQPINIRVNGKIVGKGSLLAINDHVGVQISEWHI